MFFKFDNCPSVPNVDLSKATITDADNFSRAMDGIAKRQTVVDFIKLLEEKPDSAITGSEIKAAILNLSGSIDLVRRLFRILGL